MPGNPTITREQREGLYGLIRNHISCLGDIWVAMEEDGDFVTAERLGLEFAQDVRLLQDIGWRPGDEREAFELTMPTEKLVPALKRLRGDAAHLIVGSPYERREKEESEEAEERYRVVLSACDQLLISLASQKDDSA